MLQRLFQYIKNPILTFHLLFFISIALGLFQNFTWIHFIFIFIFWTLFGGLGVEITFHRYFSHKSLLLKSAWVKIFSFFGCLGLNASPLFWASVHQVHHQHADQDLDLHTPLKGYWHSYMGWTFVRSESAFLGNVGPELLKNKYQRFLHKYYLEINYLFFLLMVCISYKFYFLAILPAQILSIHQVSLVNFVCHLKTAGYRNFDTPDSSSNHRFLALFTWGLALHNNHHKYPKSPKLSYKNFEFDPAFYLAKPFLEKNTKTQNLQA